ncbi:MAG: sialate O-acetylesterase [Blastopirellula sp.]|nr:MAG: sialate O-acetylesterase [Blastopirellula sp.]
MKSLFFRERTLVAFSTILLSFFAVASVQADVALPSIFGDHMVLQRNQAIVVWGTADQGEKVTVSIGKNTATATAKADDAGVSRWKVKLDQLPAGGPHQLKVAGKNTVTFKDVLVGEVWVCSGQSNMQFAVAATYAKDLELLTANNNNLRLISVPQVGTQEPQDDFKGQWEVSSPDTVAGFSAVGYYFGRQLQQTLGVPVGLIDNSWGGSAAEAWVRRDVLEEAGYSPLLTKWDDLAKTYDHDAAMKKYNERVAKWQVARKAAADAGKPLPARPRAPRNQLAGQHRPANIYNGVLKPTIGYGIRGVIWYQGESNSGRAHQYRELFPLMIQSWRNEWGQGDFPFYWVQLADFRAETEEPGDSTWAELREAQTMTQHKLANTGQAVIVDIGEGNDIHPRNKFNVGRRLARIALAKDYGYDLVYRSPEYKSMIRDGKKITVTMDVFGSTLDTFDVSQPIGWTIAGKDKVFVKANAKIVGNNQVEVWSDAVKSPVEVRYGWADNPVTNMLNREGLPVTPFRSDNWTGITEGIVK